MLSTAQGYGWHGQLWVVSLGQYMLWTSEWCGWYEQLKVPWAQGSKCYELRAMDDMNESGPLELRLGIIWTTRGRMLKVIDTMNNSRLWMRWTTMVCGLRALDPMNNSMLSMIKTTLGSELRALFSMNNLGLWITWTTPHCELYEQVRDVDDMNDSMSHELRALDAMDNSRMWRTWTTLGDKLKALNVGNNSRLWLTWTTQGHELKVINVMNNLDYGWYDQCGVMWSGLYLLWTAQGCGGDKWLWVVRLGQ